MSLPYHNNNSTNYLLQLVQTVIPFIKFNAYGLDLSQFFESLDDKSLSHITETMHTSKALSALRMVYLSSNSHNALHWYLDTPYRHYQPTIQNFNGDAVALDLFKTLQRDGFVSIDDFGEDIDAIWHAVKPTLTKEAAKTTKMKLPYLELAQL